MEEQKTLKEDSVEKLIYKTGPKGRALIQSYETCSLRSYPDPATHGEPWTIGWGHTNLGVIKPGNVCTQEQADKWFEEDLKRFEDAVNLLVIVPISQDQFDALVSFAYNIGEDIDDDLIAEGLGDSTLLKLLNQGNYLAAAQEFKKWNRGPNGPMLGLTRRREAERKLFMGEV